MNPPVYFLCHNFFIDRGVQVPLEGIMKPFSSSRNPPLYEKNSGKTGNRSSLFSCGLLYSPMLVVQPAVTRDKIMASLRVIAPLPSVSAFSVLKEVSRLLSG